MTYLEKIFLRNKVNIDKKPYMKMVFSECNLGIDNSINKAAAELTKSASVAVIDLSKNMRSTMHDDIIRAVSKAKGY